MPLEAFVSKFTNMRFDPAGMTDDADVRIASSVMDYLFRRLALDHLPFEVREELGIFTAAERARELATGSHLPAEDSDEAVDIEGFAGGVPTAGKAAGAGSITPTSSPRGDVAFAAAQTLAAAELAVAQPGEAYSLATAKDSPLCFTCGVNMRPAGSCYVCESCGSTSGCS